MSCFLFSLHKAQLELVHPRCSEERSECLRLESHWNHRWGFLALFHIRLPLTPVCTKYSPSHTPSFSSIIAFSTELLFFPTKTKTKVFHSTLLQSGSSSFFFFFFFFFFVVIFLPVCRLTELQKGKGHKTVSRKRADNQALPENLVLDIWPYGTCFIDNIHCLLFISLACVLLAQTHDQTVTVYPFVLSQPISFSVLFLYTIACLLCRRI